MYDAVIVGARCAGAACALLLARQGHKVLLLDQATLPSDMRLSTHLVWHAGVDILQRWGLLDTLRDSGCPALTAFTLDLGELQLRSGVPGSQAGLAMAPRRLVLDRILLDAALAAGAELRTEVTVEDVLWQDGRVVGVQGRQRDGSAFSVHARLVIGADGRQSPVARAVGSEATHTAPKEAASFNTYSYFSGVPLQEVQFYSRPERMAYLWPTHDGLTVMGYMQPGSAPRASRDDIEARFLDELDAISPELAARVRAGRREDDWLSAAIPTQCRQPSGPGWALVGDASLTMDPITAGGITNALRDAETLAELAHRGLTGDQSLDAALQDYEARRNAVSLPQHLFAQDMARLAPPTAEVMQLFGALAGNQPQIDRYFGVFAQTVSPADFFSPENMQQIMQDAAQRPA